MEYIAKQGDTFDSIAFAVFGNEFLVTNLIKANPQHVGTVIFSGGEVLTVPKNRAKRGQNQFTALEEFKWLNHAERFWMWF